MKRTPPTPLSLILALSLATSMGCKKKDEPKKDEANVTEAKKAPTEPSKEEAKPPEPKPAEGPAPANAAGAAVAEKKSDNDCPKSLSGTDEVDRTIKSSCGTVPVTGEYNVEGGTLTIEAGVTLAFAAGAALNVGYSKASKLITRGTRDKPVTFTASGDKVAGSWKGLYLYDHADRSALEGTVIEFVGQSEKAAVQVDHVEDLSLKGVTIRATKGYGLWTDADTRLTELSGCTFDQIGGTAAVRTGPEVAGGIHTDNVFPKDDKGAVIIDGGGIDKATRWRALGVPYVVLGELSIEGAQGASSSLEIEAGVVIRLDKGINVSVGYAQRGTLKAIGTKDKPITFTAHGGTDPGSWGSLRVYSHATVELENVAFEKGGGTEAALATWSESELSVKSCAFRNNAKGIDIEEGTKLKTLESTSFIKSTPAIKVRPNTFGGIGANNTYDAESRIELEGGEVNKSATWRPQATAIEVTGGVEVTGNATLTLESALELTFREGVSFGVGYANPATLIVKGAVEKPVVFKGSRDEAGSWKGIHLYGNARGNIVTGLMLRNTADAGITVDEPVDVKVDRLKCAKCQGAVLEWNCKAKVTSTDVQATDGTPVAEKKPEACDP